MTLRKDVDSLATENEKKKNVEEFRAMVAKSNAFRIATIEKENTVLDLTKAITKLEEDLEKLQ